MPCAGIFPQAAAEHSVGLILALNRDIHRAHNRIRENDYSVHGLMGFDLRGKAIGVVGAGKIGRAFIAIMLGFGCKLLVHDAYPADDLPGAVKRVALAQVLAEADIISLHCPLTPQTYDLLDAAAIASLKRAAMLINTSRGGLVDAGRLLRGSIWPNRLSWIGCLRRGG